MKFLKKINKGLILSTIVLLVLVIYLVNVELTRNKEKEEIEKLCQEYIDMVDGYLVSPEAISKLYTPEERQEKAKEIEANLEKTINEQKAKIEGDLKKVMLDNENVINIQKNLIEGYVDALKTNTNEVTTSYDKEIIKIKKYRFDGDQVVVTFDSKAVYEKKYLSFDEGTLEYKEETKRENSNGYEESITLKKEDGKWKVAYADLMYEAQADVETTQVMISF